MDKILKNEKNIMKKINNNTKENRKNSTFYRITLLERGKRHDARVSLPIFKGTINPRITASSSTSALDAIYKVLDKIKNNLIIGIDNKIVSSDNLFNIFDNISASFNELNMNNDKLLSYFHNIVSSIYSYLNTHIMAPTVPHSLDVSQNIGPITKNNFSFPLSTESTSNTSKMYGIEISKKLSFKEVAIEWFNYKYTFTIKTPQNPKPLSKKTLQGYNKTMNLTIIPFFENCSFIDEITDDELQNCIDNTNGERNKEFVYVVLKMIMDYARDNNYISTLRTIKKPKKSCKNSKLKIEGHDFTYIESTRQNHWLECFEKENTDIAFLFEGMLLEGFRPEEACGLNWKSLVEDNTYIIINSAYKDFPVYNDSAEIIGHIRQYDTLKTEDSYRKLPVHPRFREILIKHKEHQKSEFKRLKLKWTEDTPMFLSRYHKPYVPENLCKCLTRFRKKYNLEYLTPYGLRHSFATFMSEKGMKDIVLMKLMGHSEFTTTQKYYIFVSDERKKKEYEIAWGLIPTKNELEKENKELTQNELELNIVMKKEFEQLQKMWMQSLLSFSMVQKNNTP